MLFMWSVMPASVACQGVRKEDGSRLQGDIKSDYPAKAVG